MRRPPRRIRTWLWSSAMAAACLARAAPPPARADDAPTATALEIRAGDPVTLDGLLLAGEWDKDATECPLGVPGTTLRAKQYRSALLLSLATDRPWPTRGSFLFFARAEGNPDAGTGQPDAGIHEEGTVRIDFEPYEHDRPHVLTTVVTKAGEERRDGEVVARASALSTAATLEMAIPFSVLGLEPAKGAGGPQAAKPRPLRWLAAIVRPGLVPKTLTFPPRLDVGASVGAPPADLRTTARWARSESWPGVGGPAAFSKTEWKAMTDADKDVTTRGAAAHLLARGLRGDEDVGTGGEIPKKDAAIERDILQNLRWIAGREPLTPTDVRALSIGLWRMNRCDEALASLMTSSATRLGGDADDLVLTARIAADAERFETAAQAYEALAARVPESLASPYRSQADLARKSLPAWLAEQKARKDDLGRDDLPIVLLRTSKGDVLLTLLEEDAPNAVKQFVHLVEGPPDVDAGKPFYDGTLFHRVTSNGLVQGGDPTSKTKGCEGAGAGGCPWWIEGEHGARHGFFRGSVGFATATDGQIRSQFFVLTGPKPDLSTRGFTCFATVRAGMDVVDRLEPCDTLVSASVLRKRPHPYVPVKKT